MLITIADLDQWCACSRKPGQRYDNDHILAWLDGRLGFEAHEIPDLPIRAKDRVWLGCQDGVLSLEQRLRWITSSVERAIRLSLGKSDVPEWEVWAEKWLSGENRTVGFAVAAYVAAARANARSAFNAAIAAAAVYTVAAHAIAGADHDNPHNVSAYAVAAARAARSAYTATAETAEATYDIAAERERQIEELRAILQENAEGGDDGN